MRQNAPNLLSPGQVLFCDAYIHNRNVFVSAERTGIIISQSIFTKWYVYFLIEQQTGRIFYVGKGTGRRVKRHFHPSFTENVFKSIEMDDIRERGHTPTFVMFYQTQKESEALSVERDLIKALACTGLTNEVAGCTSLMEKAKLKARRLLDSILPFDVWKAIRNPSEESIDNYHFIVNELQQIVALP